MAVIGVMVDMVVVEVIIGNGSMLGVVVAGMVVAVTGVVEDVVVVEVIIGNGSSIGMVVTGVVVAVVGVEVATGIVSRAGMILTGVVEDVVVVDVVIIGVVGAVVAVGSRTVSSGVSGIDVDPRCLLNHSATAVTPSCHDPYVRILPLSSLPTLPGFRVLIAIPRVPKRESCSIIAIMSRASTL